MTKSSIGMTRKGGQWILDNNSSHEPSPQPNSNFHYSDDSLLSLNPDPHCSRLKNKAQIKPRSRISSTPRRFRQRTNFILIVWTAIYFLFSFSGNNEEGVMPSIRMASANILEPAMSPNEHNRSKTVINVTEIMEGSDENETTSTTRKPRGSFKSVAISSVWEVPGVNCTPPGIDDFPSDYFTPTERKQGWVTLHFLLSMYIFYALALACDDYFVPAMECICEAIPSLSPDVAGATFMAIATSAPELFTNIIGTFITRGDIGIGTIVGSAVFNILAVVAVCGIGAGMIVKLDWYSVTRDCLCYSLSVILLITVLNDEKIYWYEALVLVSVYVLYIFAMYHNSRFKKGAEKLVFKLEKRMQGGETEMTYSVKTIDPEVQIQQPKAGNGIHSGSNDEPPAEDQDELELRERQHELIEGALKSAEEHAEEEKEEFGLFKLPWGQDCRIWIEWFIGWPIRAAYKITIPDCREHSWRTWYPITFMMCIIWIGILSYVVNWMMTIIGSTLGLPDSITGLTFIAAVSFLEWWMRVKLSDFSSYLKRRKKERHEYLNSFAIIAIYYNGTSIPEVVSSLIVSRQGLGTMALSNSIGSNTFDILMCLGLPWLIRSSFIAQDPEINYIKINSIGLEYSAIMLIASLLVLYSILSLNRYFLDRKVGLISLVLYVGFLVMASLFELNVFFTVNLPTCIHHED